MKLSILVALLAGACSNQPTGAETFTLYRNSSLDSSLRLHWATFNARESDPSYNRNNCEMASRLLNANIQEFRKTQGEEGPPRVGFWCEVGAHTKEGTITVPSSFDAEFPTDVPSEKRVPA